jgi:hypothetical protein
MGMSFPDGYGFGLVVPMGFIPVDIPRPATTFRSSMAVASSTTTTVVVVREHGAAGAGFFLERTAGAGSGV